MVKRISGSNQRIIRNIQTSMRAEGFTLSKKTKQDCYAILSGKVSAEQIVAKYISKYSKRK